MTGNQTIIHRSRFVDFTPGNITSIAFSHRSNLEKLTPSDLRVVVGRSNGDIEIWNPRNNWFQELTIPGGKGRSIEGLCWCNISGEPLRLFSIGGSTVITEWNLATGEVLKNYDCNAGVIWSLEINDNMDKLAVGCDNGTVVIIDISGGPGVMEHDTILTRQESRILTLTWNKNDFIIGGCSDGRIRIWNAMPGNEARGRLINTMKVDKSKNESTLVWSILYLPATNQIVSGDSTGSVKFWDFQYATLSSSFKPHNADVLCLTSDVTNTHVFTAGVDRKIFQFTRNTGSGNNNSMKWINSCNRLLHGNDVRAIAGYQSKGADFLVSGGVEKTMVICSMSSFADGNYRKMPLVEPFTKNVLVNKEQRLVVMWHETTIKIWIVGEDLDYEKNYKLVCKLVLKDDQNISSCALSPDGQVLVVSRNYTTKVFHLQPQDGKLHVTKLDNELLLKTGTRMAKFVDNSKIIFCTTDDELVLLDLESDDDEKFQEFETSEVQFTKSGIKVPYINNIHQLDTTDNFAVLSRGCGIVDLINIETKESKCLVRLTNFITAIKINEKRKSVIVVTAENKIYEFNISMDSENENENTETNDDEESSTSLLTKWSKHNTESIPKQFKNSKEKCQGITCSDTNENLVWFWGANWVSRVDMSVNLPVNNKRKQKKRNRDTLTITDESNFMSYEDEEDEDIEMDLEENLDISETSPRLKNLSSNKGTVDKKVFFFSDKYRPILYFDAISDNELVVVERPPSMIEGKPKRFQQPKIIF